MVILRVKDVMRICDCGESAAKIKMRIAREKLGKATKGKNGAKGADPITDEQFYQVFGLK